jgi:hypothetical protein
VPYDPGRARADLAAVLRRTQFVDTRVLEEFCPLIFSDEAEWWAWLWSHGSRRLVEQVPEDQLAGLRDALLGGLARCRDDDGYIRGRLRAHLAFASKLAEPVATD